MGGFLHGASQYGDCFIDLRYGEADLNLHLIKEVSQADFTNLYLHLGSIESLDHYEESLPPTASLIFDEDELQSIERESLNRIENKGLKIGFDVRSHTTRGKLS